MLDGAAGNAIEDDPRGRGAKEGCDPIPKFARKSSPLEEIKQVFPLNGVEGLPNIKLEEEWGGLPRMEASSKIANIQKLSWMLLVLMKALWALETRFFT